MPRARKSHHIRQDVTRLPAGSNARWRAEYRQAQYERALIGIQTDLLGGLAVEVFRASPKQSAPPAWTPNYAVEFSHDLPPEEQARRLAADPQPRACRRLNGLSVLAFSRFQMRRRDAVRRAVG